MTTPHTPPLPDDPLEFTLPSIIGQMITKQQRAQAQANELRTKCTGHIDADCIAWLSAQAAAETWRDAAQMLTPLFRNAPTRRQKPGKRGRKA